MTLEQFRIRVASYLHRNKIAPSTFGRKVLKDPAWFDDLMEGREPREATREKVLKAMKEGVK